VEPTTTKTDLARMMAREGRFLHFCFAVLSRRTLWMVALNSQDRDHLSDPVPGVLRLGLHPDKKHLSVQFMQSGEGVLLDFDEAEKLAVAIQKVVDHWRGIADEQHAGRHNVTLKIGLTKNEDDNSPAACVQISGDRDFATLSVEQARQMAYGLLKIADEIESGKAM